MTIIGVVVNWRLFRDPWVSQTDSPSTHGDTTPANASPPLHVRPATPAVPFATAPCVAPAPDTRPKNALPCRLASLLVLSPDRFVHFAFVVGLAPDWTATTTAVPVLVRTVQFYTSRTGKTRLPEFVKTNRQELLPHRVSIVIRRTSGFSPSAP